MPNYRVNYNVIGLPELPGRVAHDPTGPTIGDRAPIEATGAMADGHDIFATFAHAKAAAIRHTDTLAAGLKEDRANIRGLKEKEMSIDPDWLAVAEDTDRQKSTPAES